MGAGLLYLVLRGTVKGHRADKRVSDDRVADEWVANVLEKCHWPCALQWARPLQIGFPGFAEKCPKNVLGVISGESLGSPAKCPKNVKKMSWGPAGVQLGFGNMSKNVKKMSPNIFGTFLLTF